MIIIIFFDQEGTLIYFYLLKFPFFHVRTPLLRCPILSKMTSDNKISIVIYVWQWKNVLKLVSTSLWKFFNPKLKMGHSKTHCRFFHWFHSWKNISTRLFLPHFLVKEIKIVIVKTNDNWQCHLSIIKALSFSFGVTFKSFDAL